jgi:hypothetical protein
MLALPVLGVRRNGLGELQPNRSLKRLWADFKYKAVSWERPGKAQVMPVEPIVLGAIVDYFH